MDLVRTLLIWLNLIIERPPSSQNQRSQERLLYQGLNPLPHGQPGNSGWMVSTVKDSAGSIPCAVAKREAGEDLVAETV